MSTKKRSPLIFKKRELPETVVLAINTHGYIVLNKDGEPELFNPEGIEIVKVSAIAPGVCNILTPNAVTKNIKIVNDVTKKFCYDKGEDLNDINLVELGQVINTELKENQIDLPDIEEYVRKSAAKREAVDPIFAEHVHSSDKGFQVKDFTGLPMINKWYMREESDTKVKHHDWKMTIVNLRGAKIDFMPYVSRGLRAGEPTTNIATIIDDLKRFGVKRLLLVDFSCSNFSDILRGDIIDETATRALRRTLLKEGLFGGNNRRKRKTRRRKN